MSFQLDPRLLGEFRAEIDGRAVPPDAWGPRRAASLVKLLALSPRPRLSREGVIEALSPGLLPMRAARADFHRDTKTNSRDSLSLEIRTKGRSLLGRGL